MEAEPVGAAPMEAGADAAAAAAEEEEELFAAAAEACRPRRPKAQNEWEYIILEDDPAKSELTNEDLEAVKLCVDEWKAAGAKTNLNLEKLYNGGAMTAPQWFHFGYDSRLKVRYVAEYPNGFCLFQAALKNHPPVVARMCGSKIFTAETDLVPHQDRYQDPFVSLRVYNMAGVEVLTFEFAFRPCTLGHTVLGAVAHHLNLSKLQKSKLVLLRKDVKLKPGMSMRSWAPDHFVFPAKGSTVSLKRKLEEAGA